MKQKKEMVFSLMVVFLTSPLVTNFFTQLTSACWMLHQCDTHTHSYIYRHLPGRCMWWILNHQLGAQCWHVMRFPVAMLHLHKTCSWLWWSSSEWLCAFYFIAPLTWTEFISFSCLLLKYMLKLFSCAFSMQMTQLSFTDSMLPIPWHELVLLTWLNLYLINIKSILLSIA